MSWFKENKFIAGFAIVLALLAGALLYLVLTQRSAYTAAFENYQSKVQNLISQRALAPYRDAENLQKLQQQSQEYADLTNGIQNELVSRQPKLAAIDPSAFQGRLRESVSTVIQNAKQKNVQLPEGFYLGFGEYANALPRNEITPLLDWQLTALQAVVSRMIDLKGSSIGAITRGRLPGELSAETPSKNPPLIYKYPVQIEFRCYPASLQSLLNDLSNFSQFMIVRAVRVENDKLIGPPRNGETEPGAEAAATPAVPATTDATKVAGKIILGTEQVKVQILLDFVQFAPLANSTATPTPTK